MQRYQNLESGSSEQEATSPRLQTQLVNNKQANHAYTLQDQEKINERKEKMDKWSRMKQWQIYNLGQLVAHILYKNWTTETDW